MTRWIIALFAMALLVLGGYKGYQWWASESVRPAVSTAEDDATVPATDSSPDAPEPAAIQPHAPVAREGAAQPDEDRIRAPAVVGDNIINKCVINNQVTYTNDPCPEGTMATTVESTAVDPNGVSGFTGEKAPAVAARPQVSNDPTQRLAECHYLAAEIARMDYEFQQQLPPPVLDQIATNLKSAREQSVSLKCAVSPSEAEKAKPASKTKVVQEKGD